MKYVHTNLIAKDWKKLAEFYIKVFGCTKVLPERILKGQWIDTVTGVDAVHIEGVHLKLPGYGNNGPTLEIFQYNKYETVTSQKINRQGLAHIAFSVDDVDKCLKAVLSEGGGKLGNVIKNNIPGVGTITIVYAKDPEGNFIELQKFD
jgi:predicted enzyme related to lactoylglutathione lyase